MIDAQKDEITNDDGIILNSELNIKVIEASNVTLKSLNDVSTIETFYVTIQVEGQTETSKVVTGTTEPLWNQEFNL
jgi:hypothetical protein